MKRCPQCGREYDNTMAFCLDDGAELLYGPAAPLPPEEGRPQAGVVGADEPATAVFGPPPSDSPAGERPTQIIEVARTNAAAGATPIATAEKQRSSPRKVAKPLAALVLTILILSGGFFAYRYLGANNRQIESIAVMPFVNDNGNADIEYLSDGMTETLISSLSQLPNLNVKGRSSVFRYKGKDLDTRTLGSELGVQAILYGRVIQRGDQLTLSLELLDAATENVIWSDRYDRKQSELVSLQSEIARDVSKKLKSKLSGIDEEKVSRKYTENAEAYQLYLKGRFYWNKRTREDVVRATEHLTAATEKDPTFALAFAGLADCWALLASSSDDYPTEQLQLTKRYAAKAIELDSSLGEPHATLGMIAWGIDLDRQAGERELIRAIELNPNYATAYQWYARYLRSVGRTEEAYNAIKRAQELEPLSIVIILNVGEMYFERGDLEAALQAARQAIEIDKLNRGSYRQLATFLAFQGKYEDALTEAQTFADLSDRTDGLTMLGFVQAMSGRRTEAEAAIRELEALFSEKKATGDDLAVVYTALGDRDKAFQWLEEEVKNRKHRINDIVLNIRLRPLRDDPRWSDLRSGAGLPL